MKKNDFINLFNYLYRLPFENQKLIVFLLLSIRVKKFKLYRIVEKHVHKNLKKSIQLFLKRSCSAFCPRPLTYRRAVPSCLLFFFKYNMQHLTVHLIKFTVK